MTEKSINNYKMTISYDGTAYHGYEAKPDNDKTIEKTVTDALFSITGYKTRIFCCGRTDAGVHALNMVTSFAHPAISEDGLMRKLNQRLPEDIRVREIKKAGKKFHARFSAHKKIYVYSCYIGDAKPVFKRRYTYIPPKKPDVSLMRKAAESLIGTKDFKSFCGDSKFTGGTIKTIYSIDIEESGDYITFTYTGSGFLRYMVRIMTGTLLDIGTGKLRPDCIKEILAKKDRRYAGHTAPPCGLFLKDVQY